MSSSSAIWRLTIVCMSPSIPSPSSCTSACADASSNAVEIAPTHASWASAASATAYIANISATAYQMGRRLRRRPAQMPAIASRQVSVIRASPNSVSPNSRISLALSWSTRRSRYHLARRRLRSRKMSSKICWEYADQVTLRNSVPTRASRATHHDQVASTPRAASPQRR